MSNPLPTDPEQVRGEPATDRESRIEELLLAGLDSYFAGDFEQAINIWTRVVFLERGHSRARAYIERARGALAERQRESEELLHRGVDAFDRGDTVQAKDLINRSVEHVGPNDLALVFLERLQRLEASAAATESATLAAPVSVSRSTEPDVARRSSMPWLLGAIGCAALLGIVAVLNGPLADWVLNRSATPPDAILAPKDDPLPVVRSSEIVLARARVLYDGGHLRDALSALNTIGRADPLRVEASALQADIQRRLLEGLSERP